MSSFLIYLFGGSCPAYNTLYTTVVHVGSTNKKKAKGWKFSCSQICLYKRLVDLHFIFRRKYNSRGWKIFMYKSVHYGMSVYLSSLSKCQLSSLFTTFCLYLILILCSICWKADHSLVSIAEKLCILQPPIQWIFYILETVQQSRVGGWKLNFVCLESQQQEEKGPYLYINHSEVYSKCLFGGGCVLSDEK